MKKVFIYASALALMGTVFTGCNNSDDESVMVVESLDNVKSLYNFSKNGESTVMYDGQNTRLQMVDEIADILTEKHYLDMINMGISEKKARNMATKKAIEDARYIFPNACETKIVLTMNARSLKNFFEHRCCERAQWEIRRLATEMLRIVRDIAPTIFKTSGPICISGPCPEGKMSCGKIKEVREKFDKI